MELYDVLPATGVTFYSRRLTLLPIVPVAHIRDGMIVHHTVMPKTKVALTLDAELLERLDDLVAKQKFRNRSQAIEAALADKLQRIARTRLARESAKLRPTDEKRFAEEGLVDALDSCMHQDQPDPNALGGSDGTEVGSRL